MIVFRADTTCGIGHFMRTLCIAKSLLARNIKSLFLVDNSNIPSHFFAEYQIDFLIVPSLTILEDAQYTVEIIKQQNEKVIGCVVDSYRLDQDWERSVQVHGLFVAAIDDLGRIHKADMVIDAKWQGNRTLERYSSSKLIHQTLLLGPHFALLHDEYRSISTYKRTNSILVSLGGGGDWTKINSVISYLLESEILAHTIIDVVIGPKAVNYESLEAKSVLFPNLKVHYAPKSLSNFFKTCGMFFGALGTSLYELAACKTPAVTFSIAPNQENNIFHLQDLGHFLHLDTIDGESESKLAKMVSELFVHRDKIKELREYSSINIDGLGSERVADAIVNSSSHIALPYQRLNLDFEKDYLNESICLRKINDCDINHYLWARNRENNTWRMTITDQISRVEHYTWWFSKKRDSYLMSDLEGPLLYVWHESCQIDGRIYLIGGWFAASDRVNFSHAQLVLEWQLQLTKEQFGDATWLAVINKENRFVNLLNQRAGFSLLSPEDPDYPITKRLFPKASEFEFNFVTKKPLKGEQ